MRFLGCPQDVAEAGGQATSHLDQVPQACLARPGQPRQLAGLELQAICREEPGDLRGDEWLLANASHVLRGPAAVLRAEAGAHPGLSGPGHQGNPPNGARQGVLGQCSPADAFPRLCRKGILAGTATSCTPQ